MSGKEKEKRYGYIKDKLNELYKSYGFEEIAIPMFVPYDTYDKYDLLSNEKQLKVIDGNGNVLIVRSDATVHVLKAVSTMPKRKDEKFFYNAKIFRGNFRNGEEDEINQLGVECFSKKSTIIDSDIIALAVKSLISIGIKDIRLDLSHADFVYSLIEEIKEISKDEVETVHKYIEDKNTIDLLSFLDKKNVKSHYRDKLLDVCMLFGDVEDVLSKAKTIIVNEKMENSLKRIERVYENLKLYGIDKYVYLDLGFTNPMNYYSGIMFKIYSLSAGREVIEGGRYDRISKKFGLRDGGIGFSQNMDLTVDILDSCDYEDKSYIDYRVFGKDENSDKIIKKLIELRENGYNVSFVSDDEEKIIKKKEEEND